MLVLYVLHLVAVDLDVGPSHRPVYMTVRRHGPKYLDELGNNIYLPFHILCFVTADVLCTL